MENEALVIIHLVVLINVDAPKEREEKWTRWQVEALNVAKWPSERLVEIIVQVNVQKGLVYSNSAKVGDKFRLNF
jgi:hypothetical protein